MTATLLQPPGKPGVAPVVIAMASSAGGLQALMTIVAALPVDLHGAVIIVQHLDPRRVSRLAELLAAKTSLRVRQARTGDVLEAGCVFVAPPDRHVIIADDGTLALSAAERVQYVRPSADVLFDSVARAFGGRAAAVVLSGTGRDGAAGCVAIHDSGGRVIVQDEASSQYPGMPQAAARTGDADVVLPLGDIAPELVRWTREMQVT